MYTYKKAKQNGCQFNIISKLGLPYTSYVCMYVCMCVCVYGMCMLKSGVRVHITNNDTTNEGWKTPRVVWVIKETCTGYVLGNPENCVGI